MIYELTEFYCLICKEWHRKGEKKFDSHLNLYKPYFAFKVEKISSPRIINAVDDPDANGEAFRRVKVQEVKPNV